MTKCFKYIIKNPTSQQHSQDVCRVYSLRNKRNPVVDLVAGLTIFIAILSSYYVDTYTFGWFFNQQDGCVDLGFEIVST